MGTSAVDCAIALDIERESYLRIEREPWRLTIGELDELAKVIGVTASQLRFPAPEKGQPKPESLDDLLEDQPSAMRLMALRTIRGMLDKQ